ncbi:MAG TPA: B12-binding domain-containing protein [Actinomycetota bacterium]
MRRPDEGSSLTISAVSSMLGIPVPTIRSWERRYGFPSPGRTAGRHRRYALHEIELLRMLRDQITRGHPAREAVALVRRAPAGGSPRAKHLEDFLASTMGLDPTRLRAALDAAAETLGVEAAVQDVALPAMREIGTRWRTGTCEVANEHLATEVVRSWLARLTAVAPPPFHPRPIVLACGPKDLHSIGLEAFGLLLARRGWGRRLLGALTPSDSVISAVRASEAIAAVVTSQRNVTRRSAVETITAVAAVPRITAFFAGDAFSAPSSRRGVPGIYLGDDLVEAVEVVDRTLVSPQRRGA